MLLLNILFFVLVHSRGNWSTAAIFSVICRVIENFVAEMTERITTLWSLAGQTFHRPTTMLSLFFSCATAAALVIGYRKIYNNNYYY